MRRVRMGKLSAGDVILLTLALTLGGAGTAQVIVDAITKKLWQYVDKALTPSVSEQQMSVALFRLRRDGLLQRAPSGFWKITAAGKRWFSIAQRKVDYATRTRSGARDTIVVFDVPKRLGNRRFLLRAELRALGFEPFQRSVWIGDGPIPKSFVSFLNDTDLISHVHIFSINKPGTLR